MLLETCLASGWTALRGLRICSDMERLRLNQLSCVNGLQNHSSSDIYTLELWEDRILTHWWVMLFHYSHLKSATQKEANRYRCQTSTSLMRWLLETTDWSTSLFCDTRAMYLTKVKDDLVFYSSKRCTSNTNISSIVCGFSLLKLRPLLASS